MENSKVAVLSLLRTQKIFRCPFPVKFGLRIEGRRILLKYLEENKLILLGERVNKLAVDFSDLRESCFKEENACSICGGNEDMCTKRERMEQYIERLKGLVPRSLQQPIILNFLHDRNPPPWFVLFKIPKSYFCGAHSRH